MVQQENYDINVELEKNKAYLNARWVGNGNDENLSIVIRGTTAQAVKDLAEAMFKIDSHGIRHWDYNPDGKNSVLK
jgi:hypothetical protein